MQLTNNILQLILTFLSRVDHPQANGDIPTAGIPSAKELIRFISQIPFFFQD